VPTHNNAAVIGWTLQSVEDSIAFFRAQDDALRTVPVEIVFFEGEEVGLHRLDLVVEEQIGSLA
jgi:hypothetical protein